MFGYSFLSTVLSPTEALDNDFSKDNTSLKKTSLILKIGIVFGNAFVVFLCFDNEFKSFGFCVYSTKIVSLLEFLSAHRTSS